eukprot:scaffold33066_cov20-Tisochrysis_lutea.AAC.1
MFDRLLVWGELPKDLWIRLHVCLPDVSAPLWLRLHVCLPDVSAPVSEDLSCQWPSFSVKHLSSSRFYVLVWCKLSERLLTRHRASSLSDIDITARFAIYTWQQ